VECPPFSRNLVLAWKVQISLCRGGKEGKEEAKKIGHRKSEKAKEAFALDERRRCDKSGVFRHVRCPRACEEMNIFFEEHV